MHVNISSPYLGEPPNNEAVVPLVQGGTGHRNVASFIKEAQYLSHGDLDMPAGVAKLSQNSLFPKEYFSKYLTPTVTVQGQAVVYQDTENVFQITNYDQSTAYDIRVTAGYVRRNGATIYVNPQHYVGLFKLIINSRTISLQSDEVHPLQPVVHSHLNSPSFGKTARIYASAFEMPSNEVGQHVSSDWQLAKDASFVTTVAYALDDTKNLVSWEVSELSINTPYYVRVRYKDATTGKGPWSLPWRFVTKPDFLCDTEYTVISPNAPSSQQRFGESLTLSADGNYLVVGAPGDDGIMINAGLASVYRRQSDAWLFTARIAPPGLISGLLGLQGPQTVTVSADGTYLALGYPNAPGGGKVFVYARTAERWDLVQTLSASQTLTGFGASVLISKDSSLLVVGEPAVNITRTGTLYTGCGQVKLYTKGADGQYQSLVTLAADTLETGANYGYSLALNDPADRLFIAAPASLSSQGKVFVYDKVEDAQTTGQTWLPRATLNPSNNATGSRYGTAVACDSLGHSFVMLSGRLSQEGQNNKGHACVFRQFASGATWSEEVVLYQRNTDTLDLQAVQTNVGIGSAVAMSQNGDTVYVGAPNFTWTVQSPAAQIVLAGAVHLYAKENGAWRMKGIRGAATPQTSGAYATSLSLGQGDAILAVGAPGLSPTQGSVCGAVLCLR